MSRETSLLSPSLIPRPRWARTPGCSGSDLDFIESLIQVFQQISLVRLKHRHSVQRSDDLTCCCMRACSLPKQKTQRLCVCHRVSNNEDTDPHTISNVLLVLAMIERNCTLTRMHASNKTVSEDEEEDYVFSRRSLYYGHAGSDVMGCRRPTDGVFTYVSSDTSHAEGVPHRGTLWGRSSKFP